MTARTRSLLIAATVASLVGVAAPTLAIEPAVTTVGLGSADGVRYKKAVATIPGTPGAYATERDIELRCDKGWSALSGGQEIRAKASHAISTSFSFEDKDFFVSAWQADEVAARLSAYVVCLDTNGLTSTSAGDFDVPGDSQVTLAAWCEDGHTVGGGLNSYGEHNDFALNGSYPVDSPEDADSIPDDGWRGYTHYYGSGDGSEGAIVSASCLAGKAPTYRSKTVMVPGEERVYGVARCPKGERTLGGGIYVTGATRHARVVASRPWDSSDSGKVPEDGWRAGVISDAQQELEMTVHAICA